MKSTPFKIGSRLVGIGKPIYIIAEMSANHGRHFEKAVELIHAAASAGADAIKLQTYTPDTITLNSCRSEFIVKDKGSLWEGRNLYELYGEAYTPWEWQPELKEMASKAGLDCFSSPFDFTAVDFLERMNVPAYKIASFELVDLPLIRKVAQTGKPTIISTGMASLAEIDEAVRAFREAGGRELALLKCNSGYPSPVNEMNLRTIPHMAEAFGVPVGLSDHTLGIAASVASVALGACIIEKHLTLKRSDGGPDAAFSLEPHDFRSMVEAVRETEQALGTINYEPTGKELGSRLFRRSLFVAQDIKAGEAFTEENIRSVRPGHGLAPKYLSQVIGRKASRALKHGTPLSWECLGG